MNQESGKTSLLRRYLGLGLVMIFAVGACALPSIPSPYNITPTFTAGSVIELTPITPRVFNTKVDGLHLGDPNAKVKIDAYEDFQCSACLHYTQTIEPDVIANLVETGKAYYTYHFFLIIDQGNPNGESHKAAEAAMCANEQGRFWDFHDMLTANWLGENAGSYTDDRLLAMAKELGLDVNAFQQCYQADKYQAQINLDISSGQALDVQGTPSVFVNGTLLTPGYIPSYDDISQAVEAALAGK